MKGSNIVVLFSILSATIFVCAFNSMPKIDLINLSPKKSISSVTQISPSTKSNKFTIVSNTIMVWHNPDKTLGYCNVSNEQMEMIKAGLLTAEDIKLASLNFKQDDTMNQIAEGK